MLLPLVTFLMERCVFGMGEPETVVIFPERDLPTTCAGTLDDMRITNAAIAPLNKKAIFLFFPKRETMD
jgi:hypothetical protein